MTTKTHRRILIIEKNDEKKKIKKIREKRYSTKAIEDLLMLEVYAILGIGTTNI